jgi:hypothetical protein
VPDGAGHFKNEMQLKKQYTRPLVLSPFESNEGHQNAIWKRARRCVFYGLTQSETLAVIDEWVSENCHAFTRTVPAREVEQQVFNAFNYDEPLPRPRESQRTTTPASKKEEKQTFVPEVLAFVEQSVLIGSEFGLESLRLESFAIPATTRDVFATLHRWSEKPFNVQYYEEMRNMVSRGYKETSLSHAGSENGFLICWGYKRPRKPTPENPTPFYYEDITEPFETFYSRNESPELVVPNPMSALTGTTQAGRENRPRTKSNACKEEERIYSIVEFDRIPSKDLQAACLWYLDTTSGGRLAMVVDSGGKSLQGWFRVKGMNPDHLRTFLDLGLALGADPAGSNLAQYFRAPWGWRFKEGAPSVQQEVVYFNAHAGWGGVQ